jgi:phage tail-like protein
MINSEFQRFTITSTTLLRENHSSSIAFNEDGFITLASLSKFADEGPLSQAIGISMDSKGILFLINKTDGWMYYLCSAGSTPVRVPCTERIINTQCLSNTPSAFFSSVNTNFIVVSDSCTNRVQCYFRESLQVSFTIDCKVLTDKLPQYDWSEFSPGDCLIDCFDTLYLIDTTSKKLLCINQHGNAISIMEEKQFKNPVNCFLSTDRILYILDIGCKKVFSKALDTTNNWIIYCSYENIIQEPVIASGIAVTSKGILYLGEKSSGTNLHFHTWNNDKYIGSIDNSFGNCRKIIIGLFDEIYTECDNKGIVVLNGNTFFVSEGCFFSPVFDCRKEETLWHRVYADLIMSKETTFSIDYFASDLQINNPGLIENKKWQTAIEITGNGNQNANGLQIYAQGEYCRADAFLTNAKGQYCVLRIRMGSNDGVSTPLLKKIYLYFPRYSYLRYLPPVYKDDAIGRDIMDRFLSLFESFNTDMDECIGTVGRYFDPLCTPYEFVPWLASWIGIVFDQNWTEESFRNLLKSAYLIFNKRGTIAGLTKMVELYCGKSIEVIEHFKMKRPMVLGVDIITGENSVVGKRNPHPCIIEDTSVIGVFTLLDQNPLDKNQTPEMPFTYDAYDFTVQLDTTGMTDETIKNVIRIVDQEKPAHTRYQILTNETISSYDSLVIGVNTQLQNSCDIGQWKGVVGVSTIVGTSYPMQGLYGKRSRIAIETCLH